MKIKQNESQADRIIRAVIGIVLIMTGMVYLKGSIQIISFIAGTAALVTGAAGFCGLYSLLGISTCPVKK
jgi:hypothetical protein